MTATLYIALVASAFPKIAKRIQKDDKAVAIPTLLSPKAANWHTPFSWSEEQEKKLALEFANFIATVPTGVVREALFIHANDAFHSLLLPLLKSLITIKKAISMHEEMRIVVVGPKSTKVKFPLLGVSGPEDPRGSKVLFGALVASCLPLFIPTVTVHYWYTARDLYCFSWVRNLTLKVGNTVYFLFSLLPLRFLQKQAIYVAKKDVVIAVRAAHQLRFARNLIEEQAFASIAVLPQYVQSRQGLFAMLALHRGYTSPRIREALFAYREAKKFCRAMKTSLSFSFTLEDGVTFTLKDIVKEMQKFPLLYSYRYLLQTLLTRMEAKKLLSFELQGKIAAMERLVADASKIPLQTLQTALVSAKANVFFPLGQIFYSDSAAHAHALSQIAAISMGEVVYKGCLYSYRKTRARLAPVPKCIAYFTQPYEPEVNRAILDTLLQLARTLSATILLRLHPRDNKKVYQDRLQDPLVQQDTCPTPDEALRKCDVAVMRTSSIAKEAIAYGKPIVLCLWSLFDRSCDSDYAQYITYPDHRTFREEQLQVILTTHFLALQQKLPRLQQALYGDLPRSLLLQALAKV